MMITGQVTRAQELQNANICLCLTDQALVTVYIQNVSYSQKYGGSNKWRI